MITKKIWKRRYSTSGQLATTIPGLRPSDPERGNFDELIKCGSLHEFLDMLHGRYGDIVSFWYGREFMVSIASHNLFKENANANHRPTILFDQYRPLFGDDSIQFCNTTEMKTRHKTYEHCYSDTENVKYFNHIHQTTRQFLLEWELIPKGKHLSLKEHLFRLSTRNMFACSFATRLSDQTNNNMQNSYDIMFAEMENVENLTKQQMDFNVQNQMRKSKDFISTIMTNILEERCFATSEDFLLVDAILKLGLQQSKMLDDTITLAMGGTHTVAFCMMWALYYLASDQKIQDKAYEEIKYVLGEDDDKAKVTPANIGELVYIKQIIRETLRIVTPAPYAARFFDWDCNLGGHHIPARTPIIHALGVALHDPSVFPNPTKFQPDRFDEQKMRKIPAYGFEPFGFAGKRRCPGWKFAYLEATIVLAMLVKKFRVSLVPGQKVKVVYGLASKPADHIWITIDKRHG